MSHCIVNRQNLVNKNDPEVKKVCTRAKISIISDHSARDFFNLTEKSLVTNL